MNWYIRDLFKLFRKTPVVLPQIEERWILKCRTSNPFTRDIYSVDIIDLKEDWVLYTMSAGTESSLPIEDFVKMYQKREV